MRCRICDRYMLDLPSGCCSAACERIADRRADMRRADAVFSILFLTGLVMVITAVWCL